MPNTSVSRQAAQPLLAGMLSTVVVYGAALPPGSHE